MDLSLFGSRVKAERKRQSMTLEVLAERIGISRNFLWEIEAGRKTPAINTLYNLGVSLSVSLDYLMGVTDERRTISGETAETERERTLSALRTQLDALDDRQLQFVSDVLSTFAGYISDG